MRHQDAKVNLQSVRDFARGRLAGFKVPGLILIEPEIRKALNLLRMSGHL
ncbi:hypothetical protein ACE10X_10590 [Bradyrhizobium sp. Pha-3]